MDIKELQSISQNSCLPYSDQLGTQLGNYCEGMTVYVVGAGPSAADFDFDAAKAEGAFVIVCNGAVSLYPKADLWITSEAMIGQYGQDGKPCFPWFYEAQDFQGIVVWERHATFNSAHKMIAAYSDDFLRRIVWHCRFHWRDHCSIRNIGKVNYGSHKNDGLWFMPWTELKRTWNAKHTEPIGTVLMQAMHLAGIMGAAKIVVYGGELMYRDGQRHAYDDSRDYVHNKGLTEVVRFNIGDDGEPHRHAMGEYESTHFFIESSFAIRQMIEQASRDHPDLVIEDRSGGLLVPGVIGKELALGVRLKQDDYLAEPAKKRKVAKVT